MQGGVAIRHSLGMSLLQMQMQWNVDLLLGLEFCIKFGTTFRRISPATEFRTR